MTLQLSDAVSGKERSFASLDRSFTWLGDSEMAHRVVEYDWSWTSLGPIAKRPLSLKSAVAIGLRSRFQMAIYWGPELICIYNDAERDVLGELHVRDRLIQMTVERSIDLEDAVVVDRDDRGKVKLHQIHRPAAAGAAGGALWGGLIGLLFLAPLLGMVLGAAAGGAAGAMTDRGVSDDFMRQLGTKLPDGGAALIVLVRKALPHIQQYRLREVLEGATASKPSRELAAGM